MVGESPTQGADEFLLDRITHFQEINDLVFGSIVIGSSGVSDKSAFFPAEGGKLAVLLLN